MNQTEFLASLDTLIEKVRGSGAGTWLCMNQEMYSKLRHTQRKGRHFRPHNIVSANVDRFRLGGNFTLNKEYNSRRPHPQWDRRSVGDIAYSRSN